jgi:hypothetical protein
VTVAVREAGVENVEVVKGSIEDIPLAGTGLTNRTFSELPHNEDDPGKGTWQVNPRAGLGRGRSAGTDVERVQ